MNMKGVTVTCFFFYLQVASPGFPALEELSVAGNAVDGFCSTPVMDDNSVERILKSSHKLKLLDVRGCSRVSDSSLVRVPAWDLEHLFLSGKLCLCSKCDIEEDYCLGYNTV
jgi:hypothetical protein